MRILYVRADGKLARRAIIALQTNLFVVDEVDTARLHELAPAAEYDGIVFDLHQSPENGALLLRRLREMRVYAPILAFNGCHSPSDRIHVLQAGADDCLPDPVSLEELVVRTRVLVGHSVVSGRKLRVADLELDYANLRITRGGRRIDLKPKEFAILEYLLRNAGRPVTRSMIVEHVWKGYFEGLTNVVDVHVNHLRSKIDRGFKHKLIRTRYGIGYELAASEEESASASPRATEEDAPSRARQN